MFFFLFQAKFNDAEVEFSKELTPTQVKAAPTLNWNAQPNCFYTVCMTGKKKWFTSIKFVNMLNYSTRSF